MKKNYKHNVFVISVAALAFVSGIAGARRAEALEVGEDPIQKLSIPLKKTDKGMVTDDEDPLAAQALVADHHIESIRIDREETLEAYFKKYDSPLQGHGKVFIEVADRYGLDYRLLPAIAGMESTFCKRILPNSYNCWGWGIYGNNAIYFSSFEEGIEKVGKGIHDGYVVKGIDTPEKMAPIYTPPNPHNWLNGVTKFMNEMDKTNVSSKLVVK